MTTEQGSALRDTADRRLSRIWQHFLHSLSSAALFDDESLARLRRIQFIGALGVIGHPLYFVIWAYVFPQAYENLGLRLLCTLLFIPLLFATRLAQYKWLPGYALFAITVGLPFAFVFLYLENSAAMVWAESLVVAVLILFHFSTAFALISLATGTAAAVALFLLGGHSVSSFPWADLLEQVPIVAFVAAVLIIIKLDKQILVEQKQRGMALALGTVAHELRTPLASLAMSAKGIQSRLPEAIRADSPEFSSLLRAADRMRADVNRASNSIELLVASTKNPHAVGTEWFDPHETICSVIDAYPFELDERAIVHVATNAGIQVLGNAALFGHVITNLTKNALEAIRRVGKGEVRIAYDQLPHAVEIVVRDTGAGVSPAVLRRMFQPFFSYPAHRGTGIGLTFCKKVLRSWGASISCDSVEREFTEFRIRFPNPRW
ncbi:HAMP domain-containing sensor histidine kinase [Ralstonia sp.]|uniref:sensor histidine kinase n=1 Tax=Ralstonia sp. TaxID=54061 RepID=UPI0031D042D7